MQIRRCRPVAVVALTKHWRVHGIEGLLPRLEVVGLEDGHVGSALPILLTRPSLVLVLLVGTKLLREVWVLKVHKGMRLHVSAR